MKKFRCITNICTIFVHSDNSYNICIFNLRFNLNLVPIDTINCQKMNDYRVNGLAPQRRLILSGVNLLNDCLLWLEASKSKHDHKLNWKSSSRGHVFGFQTFRQAHLTSDIDVLVSLENSAEEFFNGITVQYVATLIQ